MKDSEIVSLVTQSFPIFMLLGYFLYPFYFQKIIHTTLGKMIGIAMIVLYTEQHVLYGLFACLLFILMLQCLNDPTIQKISKKKKKTKVENVVDKKELSMIIKDEKYTTTDKAFSRINCPKENESYCKPTSYDRCTEICEGPSCSEKCKTEQRLLPKETRGSATLPSLEFDSGEPVVITNDILARKI